MDRDHDELLAELGVRERAAATAVPGSETGP